jgi:nitrite reductase/ring-hydroxylating ferredoxin subunit
MTAPALPFRVLADDRRLGEGAALRFVVAIDGIERPAFVVRWRGACHAYLNVCRHQGRELDFGDGRFFDDDYDALVCCHHGARYDPANGRCACGPCAGGVLTALALEQRGPELWVLGPAARQSPG